MECKRKITVYSGTHIGGPFEIMREEILEVHPDVNTILLGDIIDLANCAHKEKNTYFTMARYLNYRHGSKYIFGDEERMTTKDLYHVGPDFVAIYGGFQVNPNKAKQYRSKPWGCDWFSRIFSNMFTKYKRENQPNVVFLERACEIAKFYNVKTIICGYFNPGKLIDSEYNGIRILIVPRGKTEIYI